MWDQNKTKFFMSNRDICAKNGHVPAREQMEVSKDKLRELCRQQDERDIVLANLVQRRNKLAEDLDVEPLQPSSEKVQKHYRYILPLVKDIHLLELKVKELQKEYEKKKLKCEAARLGQVVFVESLGEEECVLKRFARELREISAKEACSTDGTEHEPCYVCNITHRATSDGEHLNEDLGFTILYSGVHVRVRITSQIPSQNSHIISPQSAKVGVNSDTYVPHLEDKVRDVLAQSKHVSEIVSLVVKYAEEDIAPFCIVIPMKKKGKKGKSGKSQNKKKTSDTSVKKPQEDQHLS